MTARVVKSAACCEVRLSSTGGILAGMVVPLETTDSASSCLTVTGAETVILLALLTAISSSSEECPASSSTSSPFSAGFCG